MSTIGQTIRKLLDEKNIAEGKLLEALQISPYRLTAYLDDKREPDFETLAKIAQFFSVSLHVFSSHYPALEEELFSDISELITVTIQDINAQRPARQVRLNRYLLGITQNSIVFHVDANHQYFAKDSYLLCSALAGTPANGDYLLRAYHENIVYQWVLR